MNIKERPCWERYFDQAPVPSSFCVEFGHPTLKRALEFINQNTANLNRERKLNLVLGGFSPRNETALRFINHCSSLRPQQQDHFFLLDFNRQPFERVFLSLKQKRISPVQADLTKLPFRNSSLDLIFLDATTMFMSDQQVKDFAQEANRTLTEAGLVVSCFQPPILPSLIEKMLATGANRVPVYSRSEEKQYHLFCPPLNLVRAYSLDPEDYNLTSGIVFFMSKNTTSLSPEPKSSLEFFAYEEEC